MKLGVLRLAELAADDFVERLLDARLDAGTPPLELLVAHMPGLTAVR